MKKNIIYKNLFAGRINRKNYFIVSLIIAFFGIIVLSFIPNTVMGILLSILAIPYMARRLHDINLSGYGAILIWFLSQLQGPFLIVAGIISIYLFFKKGDKNINQYGHPPNKQTLIEAIVNSEDIRKISDLSIREVWLFISIPISILLQIYSQLSSSGLYGFSYDARFIGRTLGVIYIPIIIFTLLIIPLIALPFYLLNKKQNFVFIFSIVLFLWAMLMFMGTQ